MESREGSTLVSHELVECLLAPDKVFIALLDLAKMSVLDREVKSELLLVGVL